jgi:hypothetical protein
MLEVDGTIKTDDMALATVLIINGYNPVMERRGGTVIWVVRSDEVEEDTEDLIHEYMAGGCLVEPVRFIREAAIVRDRMYRFLGIPPKMVRPNSASA